MNIFFFIGLLLVVLFSVILEVFLKNPYIVTGIIAVIALVVFALLFDTLGLTFIIWIVVYTILAFITALITCKFLREKNRNEF